MLEPSRHHQHLRRHRHAGLAPATAGPPSRRSSTARRVSRRRRRAASTSTRSNRIYIADTGNNVDPHDRRGRHDPHHRRHRRAGLQRRRRPGDSARSSTRRATSPSAPNGTLYIADTMNNVVRAISPDGISRRSPAPARAASPATAARRRTPSSIAPTASASRRTATSTSPTPTTSASAGQRHLAAAAADAAPDAAAGDHSVHRRRRLDLHLRRQRRRGLQRRRQGSPRDGAVLAVRHRVPLQRPPHLPRLEQPQGARDPRRTRPSRRSSASDFVGDGPADLSDLTPAGAPTAHRRSQPPDRRAGVPQRRHHLHGVAQPQDPRHRPRDRARARADGRRRRRFVRRRRPGQGRARQPAAARRWDRSGNFFLIDQRNQRIRVIYDFATERENAIIDTVARHRHRQGLQRRRPGAADPAQLPAGGNPEPSGGLALGPRRGSSTSPTPTTTASARSTSAARRLQGRQS